MHQVKFAEEGTHSGDYYSEMTDSLARLQEMLDFDERNAENKSWLNELCAWRARWNLEMINMFGDSENVPHFGSEIDEIVRDRLAYIDLSFQRVEIDENEIIGRMEDDLNASEILPIVQRITTTIFSGDSTEGKHEEMWKTLKAELRAPRKSDGETSKNNEPVKREKVLQHLQSLMNLIKKSKN